MSFTIEHTHRCDSLRIDENIIITDGISIYILIHIRIHIESLILSWNFPKQYAIV